MKGWAWFCSFVDYKVYNSYRNQKVQFLKDSYKNSKMGDAAEVIASFTVWFIMYHVLHKYKGL